MLKKMRLTIAALNVLMAIHAPMALADEDFFPGMLAKYSVGAQEVERVDKVLSFDWGANAPDERLPRGDFKAEWSSNLLVRMPGTHRFHAVVAGEVSIFVDGREVLTASEEWGFISGAPFELTAGDHGIRVTYSTSEVSDKPRAKLAVFWSSDQFTLEPLPADVLYRDEPSPEVATVEHGRLIADSHRCVACHRSDERKQDTLIPPLAAPSLNRVKGSQDRLTLINRLWRPQNVVPNSRMPSFDLAPVEAENVAEFLLSVSKDAHKDKEISFKDGDVDAGSKLLNSLGCAACHQLPGFEQQPLAAPYEGPDLTNIATRRSTGWLNHWLEAPATLNANHRMPVFELSKDERRQIVAALAKTAGTVISWTASATKMSLEERVADGKRIVVEANCAACHDIPGIKATPVPRLVAGSFGDPNGDCINPADTPNLRSKPGKRVPSFYSIVKTSNEQRVAADETTDTEALRRYTESQHAVSDISATDIGQRLLRRNGCVACHDRNNDRGLSSIANMLQKTHPDLKGQSQGLVPPSLTAVGDKLDDAYLKKAVAGEQAERRLPWLLVRMPKFGHSDADRAALVHHLVTTDRIPDEADAVRQEILADVDLSADAKASTEELLLGNQLTGAGGFNCVACHKAGPFEPRNVALGTRGSDIMTMGGRIRPRFFQRWMKNPIRVVSGIEMPAIKKAMPDVLGGSLPKQIGTIWKALSDERFTPPTVTSRFEQVVNVRRGEAPRIIRDVFTIGTDKKREAVARAMAIGFDNGHNILIDLDTMQIRLWTIGEFARQRTEGKSWYWDMPGVVVRSPDAQAFAFPLKSESGATIAAVSDEGRTSELLSYRMLPNGVELVCRSWFDLSEKPHLPPADQEPHFTTPAWNDPARALQAVVLKHEFTSVHEESGTGWKRAVYVVDVPAAHRVVTSDAQPLANGGKSLTSVNHRSTGDGSTLAIQQSASAELTISLPIPLVASPLQPPEVVTSADRITSTPGFDGTRLPIDASIMPTAMTWLPDGRMAFTSLKGHVWIAEDTDSDGLPDKTWLFEEGLAAPFGILADGDSIIVSHKPEILRLRDTDGDGRADLREVVASGWGYNDNYHDWASGLIRDEDGNMYLGLGSDYSQKTRPESQDRWRGGVIKIDPSGIITPLGMSMRYPMGLAFDSNGNLFATDNQGVQNTFNEINHILPGKHYGVPSAHQPTDGLDPETPSLMVPHPWTRSVNSILFLPPDFPVAELRGHGIGCEYDSRFLMRFTVQNVNGTLQGACYRFSLPDQEAGGSNFIGPICSAVSPNGEIYIGSIWDSGWQGGRNTGGITRLIPSKDGLANGIQEVTATPTGFDVQFFHAVDATAAMDPNNWSIQGYTRKWGGSYATPDSGRYTLKPDSIEAIDGGKRIRIALKGLKAGYLYDLSATGKLTVAEKLWPSEAHYSMKVMPR